MILSDGTDTRAEVARPGRFCDGMAVVLLNLVRDGVGEHYGDFTVSGDATVIGRRVLWASSQGFLSSSTHETELAANLAASDAFPYEETDDDCDHADSAENHPDCPNCVETVRAIHAENATWRN